MSKLHYQTGPVTSLGKEISSRNATTHGGTSEKLIVAGERREDFDALLDELIAEYAPVTAHDCGLVEDAAFARWFLWRKQRAFNTIEASVYAAEPEQEKWAPQTYHQLALAERYKTAAERALKRALSNLHALRKQSLQESDRMQRNARWEAAHQFDQRRLELQEARHQIAANREARLAKKEEVTAEVAIARATDFLDERKQQRWKAACNGFEIPTLVQKIKVRITPAGAVTEMSPSNEALLQEANRELHPPQQVHRKFWFPHGMPPEYGAFPRAAEYRHQKRHTMELLIDIAPWREIVAQEEQLGTGHALPGSDLIENL